MGPDRASRKMQRRQFVRLSGAVGATGVLGLVAAGDASADGGPVPGAPSADAPGAPGTAPCPTPSQLCGYPTDTGGRYDLWDRVQVCEGTKTGACP
ncbi:hypothetical protein GCM10029963_03690 [Micromonospora andamanensis]